AGLVARLDEGREMRAGGDVHDLDLLESQELRRAHEERIDAQAARVGVRDGGVADHGPQQGAHHRSTLMLSIRRVRPTRIAPATSRSRLKSAGASNVSGS